jgi:4-hydroxybenzoate polyprenyltransferase
VIPFALLVCIGSTAAGGVVLFLVEPSNTQTLAVAALFASYLWSAVYLKRATERLP